MKRARIKAVANISVSRKLTKPSPTVSAAERTEENCVNNNETVNDTNLQVDSQLLNNIKTELCNNTRQDNDSETKAILHSKFINVNNMDTDECEIKNASKFNIKLEKQELHIYHEVAPVIIDKGSCQNEMVLPTQDHSDSVTNNILSTITEPEILIETAQNEHFQIPNENRVTIHDVIHTKLYAKLANKNVCSYCNGIGCTADHSVLQYRNADDTEEPITQRVKVGSNGQLVIDDGEDGENAAEDPIFVNNSETYKFNDANSKGGYRKRKVREWSAADTTKFYKALKVFGTDFNLMQSWFPNKTRNEIKLKFKKEERNNRVAVDNNLKGQQFNGTVIKIGIEKSMEVPEKNFNSKVKQEKRKPKKRKCRIVINSIELSSTDTESDGNEELRTNNTSSTKKTVENNSTYDNNNETTNSMSQKGNMFAETNKMRLDEVNNILKSMKTKQETYMQPVDVSCKNSCLISNNDNEQDCHNDDSSDLVVLYDNQNAN